MIDNYTFSRVTKHDDGSETEVKFSFNPNREDGYVKHDTLAIKFNEFLDACGYLGHNYTNTPKFDRETHL